MLCPMCYCVVAVSLSFVVLATVATVDCDPNRSLKLQSGFLHANTQWMLDTTRDSRLMSEAMIASTCGVRTVSSAILF